MSSAGECAVASGETVWGLVVVASPSNESGRGSSIEEGKVTVSSRELLVELENLIWGRSFF